MALHIGDQVLPQIPVEHGQFLHGPGEALGLVLGVKGGAHHDHRGDIPIFHHVVQHGDDAALGRIEEVPRRHGPAMHQVEDVIPGLLVRLIIAVGQIHIGGLWDGGLRGVRVVPAVVGDFHHLPGVVGWGKVFLRHHADILGLPPRRGIIFCGLHRLGGLLLLGLCCTGFAAARCQAQQGRCQKSSKDELLHVILPLVEERAIGPSRNGQRAGPGTVSGPARRFKGILTRESSCCGASGQTWGRCGPRSRCGRCPAPRSPPCPRY